MHALRKRVRPYERPTRKRRAIAETERYLARLEERHRELTAYIRAARRRLAALRSLSIDSAG